ncbi:TPA: hypothetical protein MFL73_004809 [Klebsiella pneumoniae]|nr:hypothetical protein [Klebsiella pneumoniae]HBW8437148.1 hypothetical protein [Klebsiella pneumoniae]HBW8651637.1 hypothetical protein [Klebsiella pneumoniae]HBW8678409.1 hypothetical protein [Klebsiella pneumoniae]HBW8717045.1 hypothetical protein [Klebsiella pneumoniae]
MPSEPVCIGKAYADGEDMRMSDLCRCRAYGYALHIYSSLFSRSDPKKGCPGSAFRPPARCGPATQDVAVFSAGCDAICCVLPLPRDRPLTTIKGRYGYFVCVVQFRKSVKL